MSRKDYVKFAELVNDLAIDEKLRRHIALRMIEIFQADNRAFSADKFLAASGCQ